VRRLACRQPSSERSFVPDDFQRSGDRRELGVRIYRFELRRRGFGSQAHPGGGADGGTTETGR
jgi:hypothetical protein